MGIWMWLSHYLSWKKRFFLFGTWMNYDFSILSHDIGNVRPSQLTNFRSTTNQPWWSFHGSIAMIFFSQSSTVPSMKLRIGGTITIRYRNIVLHTQNMYNIYINLQLVNFIHIWLICRNFMVKSLWSMFICPGNLGLADCTAWSGLEGCTHYILLEMDLPKLLPIHRYSCFIHRHT
jgi:hypothetical protein